ncbi:hypothetical protein FBU31_002438 [Coemansia sp. 'formosensis']|nr:hypothetical protein FBU31_002438 [Coemansia sp. 'formosensis']
MPEAGIPPSGNEFGCIVTEYLSRQMKLRELWPIDQLVLIVTDERYSYIAILKSLEIRSTSAIVAEMIKSLYWKPVWARAMVLDSESTSEP